MRRFLVKFIFIGFLPTVLLCLAISCQSFPRVYGLCIICHARDMLNYIIDNVFSARYLTYGFFLTPFGVVVGALMSSGNKPWVKRSDPVKFFIYGFFSAIGASLIGMCPVRITSLLAWFSFPALIALIGFIIGVFLCLKLGNC